MQSIREFQSNPYRVDSSLETASMPKKEARQKTLKTLDDHEKETEPSVEKSLEYANRHLKLAQKRIDRQVHEVTKAVIYKVIDTNTDEVLSEYPSKRVQDIVANLMELSGAMFDKRI